MRGGPARRRGYGTDSTPILSEELRIRNEEIATLARELLVSMSSDISAEDAVERAFDLACVFVDERDSKKGENNAK